MAIFDLFSKRQARLRGEVPDVFVYDTIPKELRIQIVHIFRDCLGTEQDESRCVGQVAQAYTFIVKTLCREHGWTRLPTDKDSDYHDHASSLFNFIVTETNVERVIDAIEVSCKVIDIDSRNWEYLRRGDAPTAADDSLSEINTRFQQHGVGYRYESGQVVRIDSELVHTEVVKPALSLLHDSKYKGAEAEFHSAFEHYRHGRSKEALSECLKALESTMKSIAAHRNWSHGAHDTAKPLLDLMFKMNLIPQFWAQHFSSMRAMLESGVPTARNRMSGHGQGPDIVDVPSHYVAFALHQTAAAIVFLTTAESVMPYDVPTPPHSN